MRPLFKSRGDQVGEGAADIDSQQDRWRCHRRGFLSAAGEATSSTIIRVARVAVKQAEAALPSYDRSMEHGQQTVLAKTLTALAYQYILYVNLDATSNTGAH